MKPAHANRLIDVSGVAGRAKSAAVVDMAASDAAGRFWFGTLTEKGLVVYVAGPASTALKHRLRAWRQHHGIGRLDVLVVAEPVDVLDADRLDALRETIAEATTTTGAPLRLVVFDGLGSAMPGRDESPATLGTLAARLVALRDVLAATVVLVADTGQDEAPHTRGAPPRRARSWAVLRAVVDVELEVKATAAGGKIHVRKPDATAGPLAFMLQTVAAGPNRRGRTVRPDVAVACSPPLGRKVGP